MHGQESAKARRELECELDVRFGPTGDETVDVFPANSYLQPKLLLTHEVILQQSPYLNISHWGPPLLVTFGEEESEEFHRQATDYLDAWRGNGLRGELLMQEAKHHFSAIEGLTDADSPLCQSLVDFMTRCENGYDPVVTS